MIEPEQVPYDAMRAGLQAWMGSEGTIMSAMERAIAAAINAWPDVVLYPPDVLDNTINPTRIILPLPQEARDE